MKEIRLRVFGEAVIEVGDTQVTPASSHIFALLLLLTLGPKEGWTRRELMEMLFEGVEAKEASHRLRQLLYKLRGMGVELGEERGGLTRIANELRGPLDSRQAIEEAPAGINSEQSDWILPHYVAPKVAPFQNWVEDLRDRLTHDYREALVRALRRSHSSLEWGAAIAAGKNLLARDPFNLEALKTTAEALACHGSRDEAVALLESHVTLYQHDDHAIREVKRVRTRVASMAPASVSHPLRGREIQLAALVKRIGSTVPAQATLSVVEGVPGIGKSRLAQALGDILTAQGVPVLRFDCSTHTRHIPLAPFVDAARRLMKMRGALGASPDFKDALQRLTNREHDTPWPSDEAEMVTRRLTIQHALTDLIGAVTSETPAVLIVDDAHLLDDASLDLMRTLSETSNAHAFHTAVFLRPGTQALSFLAHASDILLISLPPLSEEACRAVLRDIHDNRLRPLSQIEHTLSMAGGNPFFLQLLAKHDHIATSQPIELRSLADATYAKLADDTRLALEICLLLDNVATLPRLEQISSLQGAQLIAALRQLEQDDLVRLEDGRLIGPHALLKSAIRQSIPTSVCGALHRRIASALTNECLGSSNDPDLALAAIQHWLDVNDGSSALALARKCANRAVDLGEPSTAVHLLDSIPRAALELQAQRTLLDDIIRLSHHARHSQTLISALRERIALSDRLGEDRSETAQLELQLITTEDLFGSQYPSPVQRVRTIASDEYLKPSVRIRAVSRLLVSAFLDVDVRLAAEAFERLARIPSDSTDDSIDLLRSCAELVYHTTFGSRDIAFALIGDLSRSHPLPRMDRDTQMARSYAGFAAMRLGAREVTRKLIAEELAFAEHAAAFGVAENSALMLADLAIMDGEYSTAESYLSRVEQIGKRRRDDEHAYSPGYYSSAACIAIHKGDFQRATLLLSQIKRTHASMASPRYRAISLALELRMQACQGKDSISLADLAELRGLFARASSTGAQDPVLETLWRCESILGLPGSATYLLREYLQTQRREVGAVEADLWLATKSDEVWDEPQFAMLKPSFGAQK